MDKDDFWGYGNNRRLSSTISEDLLLQYNQIWIFSGMDKSSGTFLSDNEVEIITEINQFGSGLLIGVGQQGDSAEGPVDINRLAKEFGITWASFCAHAPERGLAQFVDTFRIVPEIMGKWYKMIN